jgi:ribosome recycling factor
MKMVKEILKDAESRMKKAVTVVAHEFATIRAGRVSPALLEHVYVDYYGTKTPLNHLASISAPEPLLLIVQPWDKNALPEVEKAILQSDLGVNPSTDGNIIRLAFPPLTEERRKEYVKMVHRMAEDGRVAIRNIRREANESLKELKDEGEISEDEYHRYLHKVQELTDKYVEEINKMLEKKEKDIMEV